MSAGQLLREGCGSVGWILHEVGIDASFDIGGAVEGHPLPWQIVSTRRAASWLSEVLAGNSAGVCIRLAYIRAIRGKFFLLLLTTDYTDIGSDQIPRCCWDPL